MAFLSSNNAYDISVFEDENLENQDLHKKNKVVKIPKKKIEQAKRRKRNPLKLTVSFLFSAVVVAVVGMIIYSQVQLTELNQKISEAQETLENSQSEYTQMQMNVDAKYTTSIIEEYAQDKLGMTKANSSQKEFVDLSSGDKAKVVEKEDKSIFDTIVDWISSIWS
jgi:cell division protein FtsL